MALRAWSFRYHELLQLGWESDGVRVSSDYSHKVGRLRLIMYMPEMQIFRNSHLIVMHQKGQCLASIKCNWSKCEGIVVMVAVPCSARRLAAPVP